MICAGSREPGIASRNPGSVHVVAGVILDGEDRVLLAQRPAGSHLAGGWEFPGGKAEHGETRFETLVRELREELGIEVAAARPMLRVRHPYPERVILLDVWMVTDYRGVPGGLDGQFLRWCPRAELPHAQLLPADRPIVTVLRLPERLIAASGAQYVLGDFRDLDAARSAAAAWAAAGDGRLRGMRCGGIGDGLMAVSAGADFLVTRTSSNPAALGALCRAVNLPVYAQGLPLEAAWEQGAAGVSEIPEIEAPGNSPANAPSGRDGR